MVMKKTGVLLGLLAVVGLLMIASNLRNYKQNENVLPVSPSDSATIEESELEAQEVLEGANDLTDAEDYSSPAPMGLDYTDDWCYTDQLNEQGIVVFEFELVKWRNSLGYFSKSAKTAYASYDGDTLRSLGQQGDLLALNVLYDQLLASKETYASAVEILDASVAFGSTKSAILVATNRRLAFGKKRDDQERQLTDDELIEVMAYYEIAARRGDVAGLREGWQLLRSLNRSLSETETREVQTRASAILHSLGSEHNVSNSAHSESENSYSKAAERYRSYKFRMLASRPGVTGWGGRFVELDLCTSNVE